MSTPSFARATAASKSKATPQGGASKDVAISPQTPTKNSTPGAFSGSLMSEKKLKRPSTLTKRTRESIAYKADLYYIKPANRSKPCPLADLPSEIRTQIYSYVFGDLRKPILMNYGRVRHAYRSSVHVLSGGFFHVDGEEPQFQYGDEMASKPTTIS